MSGSSFGTSELLRMDNGDIGENAEFTTTWWFRGLVPMEACLKMFDIDHWRGGSEIPQRPVIWNDKNAEETANILRDTRRLMLWCDGKL
jgi:hypothetical protein